MRPARHDFMTFRGRRCCTLEGNYYAVSDGACLSAASCGNLEGAADKICDGYELGRRGRCEVADDAHGLLELPDDVIYR